MSRVSTPSPALPEDVTKPPLPWLLAYRVLGLRLPPRYRPWVAKDVTTKFFLTWRIGRNVVWGFALLALYYVAQSAIYEPPALGIGTWMFKAALAMIALCLLESGATLVRHTLRWQRIDRHGRPVRPKQGTLAVLDNKHAAILGAVVLVAFTGASAVFADSVVVPDGPLAAKCHKPSTETVNRIRSGLKDPATKFSNLREVRFGKSRMVAASVEKPGTPQKASIWVVSETEIYEFALAEQSVTTFDQPTSGIDRVGSEALQRVVKCLTDVMKKK